MLFWQDLRYGIRSLLARPGFFAVAVTALALGIGANTAIFSVVNAVLLRPLPFRDPDQLVMVWETGARRSNSRIIVSPANYLDWRAANSVFSEMGAYTENFYNVSSGTDYPERVDGIVATPSLFSTLGVEAVRGRVFSSEDKEGENVAVIGHGLWQRRFGADPQVIGQMIGLNGEQYTIIGVMPPEFRLSLKPIEVLVPLRFGPEQSVNRSGRYLTVMARLKEGVTVAQARAEMGALGDRLAAAHPEENAGSGAVVYPLHQELVGSKVRTLLFVLLGAVGFVLLIACANVANLLLARAAGRRREIAVRTALGASRWRLVRQMLTESLLLSLLAGGLGLVIAQWGVDLLVSLGPAGLPPSGAIRLDRTVLAFTLLVALLTGLAFGLVPALQSSRVNVQDALKEGVKGTAGLRHSLTRNLLVVAEVSLSLLLLIGAGLMLKSFVRMLQTDPGFRPENVIAMDISLTNSYDTPARRAEFFRQAAARIETLPGVLDVGITHSIPLSGEESGRTIAIEGRPRAPGEGRPGVIFHRISGSYLPTMGIPLLRGRNLTERDTADAPKVVLIDETLARRHFPGEDPLGKRILLGENIPYEIVGVVAHVRHVGLHVEPFPSIFVSYLDSPWFHMSLVVRAGGEATSIIPALRREIAALDREIPLANVKTMEQYVAASVTPQRFSLLLLGAFAAIALLLAAIGVYGVMSHTVAQRTQEIGIRLALGARPGDVLRLVVGQGMITALVGVGAGLAGAFALTRVLASLLYEVSATDPAVFAGVSLFLLAVALVSAYLPARRAMKIEPVEALRYE